MSLFTRVESELSHNKKLREAGLFTCIPWLGLPRFSTVIPGIKKGRYVIVTANAKVGKSKLTDFLYMYEPLLFQQKYPDQVDLKILYFSLEVSKEEKMKQVICNKLYTNENIEISPEDLTSDFQHYILDDKIQNVIKSYSSYFKDFEDKVEFIDNVRNPYGIYHYVRDYAESHGDYISKTGNIIPAEKIRTEDAIKDLDYYRPHNPKEHVIVIVDHFSLLKPEKNHGYNLHTAMTEFSNTYALKIRDEKK